MPHRPACLTRASAMPDKPRTYRPSNLPRRTEGGKRPSAHRRGYSRAWRKARLSYLADHPFCVECKKKDLLVPATVVDHIQDHKGNPILFWNVDNWCSLCSTCHNRKTVRENPGCRKVVDAKGQNPTLF